MPLDPVPASNRTAKTAQLASRPQSPDQKKQRLHPPVLDIMTGVGEYKTEKEAAMPARQKAPDGAEPLIIQEGGEPTSSDDKPTDKSGNAKERPTANDPADRTVFRRG